MRGSARTGIVAPIVVSLALVSVSASAQPRAQPRSEGPIPAALRALEGSDVEARIAAAERLGRVSRDARARVVPALRAHLRDDPEWRVRASSGRALGRLAARRAVPDLVRALRDPVVDVRVVAAAAIWRLPDPAAVPALLELSGDSDPAARQWSALALGVIGDRRAVSPLIRLLRDPEAEVRRDVIRSLGRLGDRRAVEPLSAHARDAARAMSERLEAIDALSSLDGPAKVDALVRLLRHDAPEIRERAASGLGRVGDALVIPALREQRQSERSVRVRRAINRAVRAVEERRDGAESSSANPLRLPPIR